MPVEVKPPEESKIVPNGNDDGYQTEEQSLTAGELIKADDAQPGTEGAGFKNTPVPQKKRPLKRVIALLLIAGLAAFAYLQRERLLKLVPAKTAAPSAHPGASLSAAELPEGVFQISPEKQQLIGVQYGEVEYKAIAKTLRATGRVTFDETKITHVHTRVDGWIEQVFVDFTGKQVRKGEPLLAIYSPELWQTQQEYLLALRGRKELSTSPFKEAVNGAESIYQASRKRLELWDISEEQIAELEKNGKPTRAMTIYATADGIVLTRNAFTRQRVTPETELYTIANPANVWVIADIYEYEAPEIKPGQTANVTLSYYPGRVFKGKVTFIYPQLDSATRTLKVRVEIPNPQLTLKPEMYANVELKIDYGRRVIVPQEAVMDSGAEQQVFIAHEGGYFEPRKVQLGAKVDNEFIVLSGLKAGERIVTSANFLVDSESKLKSAAGGMSMPGMSHGGGQGSENKTPAPNAPPSGKPPLPPRQEDHSQHQPGAPPPPQPKPEDHSQHQLKKPQE